MSASVPLQFCRGPDIYMPGNTELCLTCTAAYWRARNMMVMWCRQLDTAPSDGATRAESLPRGPRLGSLGQQGQKLGTPVLKTTSVICVW